MLAQEGYVVASRGDGPVRPRHTTVFFVTQYHNAEKKEAGEVS